MQYIGAVDIGGTKIAIGVISSTGEVLEQVEVPTPSGEGLEQGLAMISLALEGCLQKIPGELAGIGIGCTGQIDPLDGSILKNAFLPGWEGNRLLRYLRDRFNVGVAIDNDAVAAALAEASWGAGRGARTMLYITVSTGIGGALVLDGKVYRGVDGSHPELGHIIIDPDGPKCFCGAYGCWERMASGRAMAEWVAAQSPKDAERLPNAAVICAQAKKGDPLALRAVKREGIYLGIGLANMVTLFSPDVIALGGGVMRNYVLFKEEIELRLNTACQLVPHQRVCLTQAKCGRETGLLGAAQVWLSAHQK
jgi:glucokinase